MFILARMIYAYIYQLFAKKPQSSLDKVSLPLRVMPWDCDANLHINNGRYLSIMDVARVQLYLGMGIVPALIKNRWSPVVTSTHLLYRRSVDLFVRYDLSSRFVGRTDRFIIVEHRFDIKGETAVLCLVALAFRDKNGVVATTQLAEAFGIQELSTSEHSEIIQKFLDTDSAFLKAL